MTTKRITYVAMLTTASVIIIVILASTTPLLAFPTLRIAFEGVLVKLTGYLFGPITGLLTGAVTELLVTLLRPSYLHWAYSLSVVLYGFFGGVAYYVKQQKIYQVLISNILIFLVMLIALGVGIGLVYFLPGNSIKVLAGFSVPKWFASVMLASSSLLAFAFVIGVPFYLRIRGFKNELTDILPILLLSVLTEYFVSITLIPIADSQTLRINYLLVLVPRIIIAPFEILGNTFVIYTVYKLLSPIIKPNGSRRFEKNSSIFWFSKKNFLISKVNRLVKTKIFPKKNNKGEHGPIIMKQLLTKYQVKFDPDKVIVITGTSGKSSLAMYLEKILGYDENITIGCFTSPHLLKWTERIRVNEQQIDELKFNGYYTKIAADVEKHDLNFFEIFTLIALLHFQACKVDYVILECGIGAKNDAVNIVKHKYGAITSVDLDHTDVLGKNILDIASDKSYVIPTNGYAVTAVQNIAVQNLLKIRALQLKTPLDNCYQEITNIKVLPTGVTQFIYKKVAYQLPSPNYNLAYAAMLAIKIATKINVPLVEIKKVIANFVVPVKIEVIKKGKRNIILDTAHNQNEIENLLTSLSTFVTSDKVLVFFSSLKRKNYQTNFDQLQKKYKTYFTTFEHPDSVDLNDIKTKWKSNNYLKTYYKNYKNYDYIVFTGSFYFIQDVVNTLHL